MKQSERIGAVMVLYQPEWNSVELAIESLSSQVDLLCVIDNTPNSDSSERFRGKSNVLYLPQGKNLGIAAAQNIGVRYLVSEGYGYVVFSDQDSSAPAGIVTTLHDEFLSLKRHGYAVGVIGSSFVNRKTLRPYPVRWVVETVEVEGKKFYRKLSVISSFSMIELKLFKKFGLFREDLFMDFVENEWHFRLRKAGMEVFQSQTAVIMHEFGESRTFLGRSISISAPSRLCVQIRNYQLLKRLDYLPGEWKRFVRNGQLQKLLYYMVVPSDRIDYLKAMSKGFFDGRRSVLNEIEYI